MNSHEKNLLRILAAGLEKGDDTGLAGLNLALSLCKRNPEVITGAVRAAMKGKDASWLLAARRTLGHAKAKGQVWDGPFQAVESEARLLSPYALTREQLN